MPEIAEAQALLAELAETDEVKAAIAQRERRLRLQTAYGQAVMWSKGYAEETKAAFAHASELAAKSDDFSRRFEACSGQWTVALARGELKSGRELASAYLREAEDAGRVVEVGVARRGLGLMCYFAGVFAEARIHCEKALDAYDPQYDQEVRERFGDDTAILAMSVLAVASWQLGEVERARELIDLANRRATELGHVPSMVHPLFWKLILEVLRGDAAAALTAAEALEALCRKHGITYWLVLAELYAGWARGRLGDPAGGAVEFRRALAAFADRGGNVSMAFFQGLLAELEAETLGAEGALARIDEALALAGKDEYRNSLAFLHRLHGDILLKRDPPDPAPAEDAYQAAIAIAKQQGARSHELLAALALAKLYQSTARPAEAHAVLAPALEGFAPTPEMPEIAEAQTLLVALAETDEVKAGAAQRQRLTQLNVAFGNALIAARGYGAPETTEAFAKVRKSVAGNENAPERLSADYGLWVGARARAELSAMKDHSTAFLNDVAANPDSPEAGVAHRIAGITHWFAGEYLEAREHLEQALALFEPGRDDDLTFRFGHDAGVGALAYLAFASWPLGEIDRAISFVERMQARVGGITHVNTLAYSAAHAATFALMSGDRKRAQTNISELAHIVREHDLPVFRAFGILFEGWAAADAGALAEGLEGMRRGVGILRDQSAEFFDGLTKIALAEAEAHAGDVDRALAVLDEALATCDRKGFRAFEAELHRVRGEMLLKRDPASPAPAEDEYQTAIAVAGQQGARSFELRAALSLAKLYRSTGRPAVAHAVLAPALEGFAPTPEMPEIAKAQALLASSGHDRRSEGGSRRRRRSLHSPMRRLFAVLGPGRPKQQKPSQPLAIPLSATRTHPSAWRPTTACGPTATSGASCRR